MARLRKVGRPKGSKGKTRECVCIKSRKTGRCRERTPK